MKPRKMDKFRKILVAQTAFLGDMVLTTPLFAALKRVQPEARITLLTTPAAAPLVEEDPNVDEIILYGKNRGESLLSVVRKVRAGEHDLYLAPHRSHRTALIGFLSQIPVRVGYGEAGFSFLYTRRIRRPMELHEVDRILELLKPIGAGAVPSDRVLHCGYTDKETAEVDAVLAAAKVTPGEKLAGLCPGSVWATKRWTSEGYSAVGRELAGKGYRIVVVGGPDDREAAQKVMSGLDPGYVDAVGATGLKALPAWVDRFGIFVTNDSAPLHVAAARGVPTVAVFGPTVKELGFFPFHENSRVVEVSLECRPCGAHGHNACPRGHFRCMREITPQMVLSACAELGKEV